MDFSKVLSLNQERVNSIYYKTLKTHTKVKTGWGRPTVRELYERLIYKQYQLSKLMLSYVAIVYLDMIENPVESGEISGMNALHSTPA